MNSWQNEFAELPVRLTGQRVQHPFHVLTSQSTADLGPTPIVVRRIAARNTLPSDSAGDRLFRICEAITHLTEEHKATMVTFRQRQRRVKTVDALWSRTLLNALRYQPKSPAYQKLPNHISQDSDNSGVLISALQASVEPVALSILRRLPGVVSEDIEEIEKAPVRKIVSKGRTMLLFDIEAEKARRVGTEIARLTNQYSTIAFNIRRRKCLKKDSFSLSSDEIGRAPVRRFISKEHVKRPFDVGKVAERTRLLGKETARLAEQYSTIAFNIRQRKRVMSKSFAPSHRVPLATDLYEREKDERAFLDIEKEIEMASRSTDQWSWFAEAANKSAIDVYGLNIALRLRIGKMIFYRHKGGRENLGVRHLESRLIELRSYDEVLFCNRPDITPYQIIGRLKEIELRNYMQTLLDLNTQFVSRGSRVRTHATIPPYWRKAGDREAREYRYTEQLRVRNVKAGRTERTSRPAPVQPTPAQKMERERKQLMGTVSSWLHGGI